MGTRGLIGFYKNGKTKATYNHFDSYPEGVGKVILQEIKHFSITQMNDIFSDIKLIKNPEDIAPSDMVFKYGKYGNPTVGGSINNREIKTWYQLLRGVQGTLKPYLTGEVEHMIDSKEFIQDSLFCEWAYIINLDTEKFEVWRGFQTRPQKNRYQLKRPSQSGYWACKRVKSYPLKRLPTVTQFLKDMRRYD